MQLWKTFGVKALLAMMAFGGWFAPMMFFVLKGDVDSALKISGASILLVKMAYDFFFSKAENDQ